MRIIAEIGTAHGGSLEKAKELIDASADAGATAIKFQWVYAEEILHPDTGFVPLPGGNIRLYDNFKKLEVPQQFFADCLEYTHKRGVEFVCSPFGLRSLDELLEIKPDAVKIASPELNYLQLLRALATAKNTRTAKKTDTPIQVILSSGVSKISDIEAALEIIGTENVSLLHCITSYPAPESEYNVRLIETLSNIFGVETGLSDHSLDPVLVPALAASFGATVFEKHICMSKKDSGLDDPVALEPEQFAQMTHALRQCEAAIARYGKDTARERIIAEMTESYGKEKVTSVIGDGVKRLAPAEMQNYGRTNRSLHFMRDMKAGEIIGEKDVAALRTEKILTPGISPKFLETVIGAKISRDAKSGDGVQFDDIIFRQ